jgi:hypothetical protein
LGPLGTATTTIVPALGDYDDREIGGIIDREPKYSEKTCPSAALSTTNPTRCPDANPVRCGGKPATNRLSYGTALTDPVSETLYSFVFSRIPDKVQKPRNPECCTLPHEPFQIYLRKSD